MPGTPGRSGPKRKPTALRLLTGNQSHRALNENEPEVQAGVPSPPAWFSEVALAKWNEIIDTCHWITLADRDFLSVYCDAWARFEMAQQLAIQSPILKDTDGRPFKNPACAELNVILQQLRSYGSELGLSTSARAGISMPGTGKRDKIAEKFFG